MKDPHHPNNKLLQLLWSGKRLRSHAARTESKREFLSTSHQDCEEGGIGVGLMLNRCQIITIRLIILIPYN